MSERLTLVTRLPFRAPAARITPNWRKIAMDAYADTGANYCEDPELLADRLGLDVFPTDDTHAEIIGTAIYIPDACDFETLGVLVYELIARTLLLRNRLAPEPHAIAAISAELALPSCVAKSISPALLSVMNPYVPLEFLRQIYMSHREASGEMPAVG